MYTLLFVNHQLIDCLGKDIQISKEHRRDMQATRKIFAGIPRPAKQLNLSQTNLPSESHTGVLMQKINRRDQNGI